ncbi:hypothetical protein Tco_1334069 [Tanacetum coccineum]
MNHQTSSVLQIAYPSPQVTTQPMTESPLMDSSFAVLVFTPGDNLIANIMDEVDIEDLTIEQYLRLTQENQAPKKIEDMTIAEYVEYEKKMNENHISNTKSYLPTYFSKSTPTHDPIREFAHYFGPNQPHA